MNTSPIQLAGTLITNTFDLDEGKTGLTTCTDEEAMDRLLYVLTHQIKYLMDHHMERLKWILYRIDVSERDLLQALGTTEGEEPERIIARMVIERQIEKAKTRMEHGEPTAGEWLDC
jgi:hypothetical protein